MKYPSIKNYIRFYKYAGIMKMVKIENPVTKPHVYIYVDNVTWGITYVGTIPVSTYRPYGYRDWAQIDKPPDYVTKLQHFQWYLKKWEKYK